MNQFSTVLIVDDDEITRFLLTAKLESLTFANQYQAYENAVEALHFLEKHKHIAQELPDLIFLDLNMPEMNGWEFLEMYKNIVSVFPKKIHMCILSSSVFEKDMERARAHPLVEEYLVKPVQKEALEELARKYAQEC
ncbi:MAG: response regulator [Cyclobacteriaceae bacterium]